MDLMVAVMIGVAIGAMVELLLPGHTPSELVLAIFLGIAGSLLARLIGIRAGAFESGDPESFVASALGAIITLLLYGAFFRRAKRGEAHRK